MAAAGPALAVEPAVDVGVQWHELRERAADGTTLVRERGVAPRVESSLTHRVGERWALRGSLSGWATRADYDGRSQGGTPLASDTDTQSVSLGARAQWRLTPSSPFQVDAGVEVEHFRRHIQGIGGFSGLDERLTQARLQLGAEWRADAGGPRVRATASWGDRAPLSVRFDGALFDPVTLDSGKATGFALHAGWPLARQWQIGLQLETLSVGRSLDAPLSRSGAVVGTVSQPRWRRDQIALTVQRVFGR